MAQQKIYFCQSDKKIGIILIHSHQMTIIVLAAVISLLNNQSKAKGVSAPNSQVLHVLKILAARQQATALDKHSHITAYEWS